MNHRIFDIYILYQNKGYFFEAIKLKKKKKKIEFLFLMSLL